MSFVSVEIHISVNKLSTALQPQLHLARLS